jgi:hypothetical protein
MGDVFLIAKEFGLDPFDVFKWPLPKVQLAGTFLKSLYEKKAQAIDKAERRAVSPSMRRNLPTGRTTPRAHTYQFR